LYVSRIDANEKYPIRSLKAFQKINLHAGESKRVEFELKPGDFSVLGTDLLRVVEPGSFGISVGGCQPGKQAVESGKIIQGILELI